MYLWLCPSSLSDVLDDDIALNEGVMNARGMPPGCIVQWNNRSGDVARDTILGEQCCIGSPSASRLHAFYVDKPGLGHLRALFKRPRSCTGGHITRLGSQSLSR